MIISREAETVEIFFSMPAEAAVEHFGVAREDLLNSEGFAVLDAYTEGTWILGDDFWTGVTAEIDGVPATFEAMSLMLHPASQPMPYRDPLDALTAIEVCTVNDASLDLSDAQLYVGLIAYTDTPTGELAFSFPGVEGDDLAFSVSDFNHYRITQQVQIWPGANGTMVVPEASAANPPLIGGMAFALLTLGLLGVGVFVTREKSLFAT